MPKRILDQETVIIELNYVKNTIPTCIIGWDFKVTNGRPHVCSANETSTLGDYKFFNVGKPLSRVKSVDKLKTALTMACVL